MRISLYSTCSFIHTHKTEYIDRRAGGGYILRQDAQFNKKVRAGCTAVGVTAASFEVKKKNVKEIEKWKEEGSSRFEVVLTIRYFQNIKEYIKKK